MDGQAIIVNYNMNADSIVAAAGRISTTQGGAEEIYYNSCKNNEEKNIKLIYKILSSGHFSVLEHINLNLAFDDVSVFVEQFMIEFRLASFTVKSRRYVDFGQAGYFEPNFSKYEEGEKMESLYKSHMNYLFDEYSYFIENGIPKEDARFILPYSFKSNFYCTVNARELIKIMNEMVYGRGKNYPELVNLGKSLFLQCQEKLPYLNMIKIPIDSRESIKTILKVEKQKKDEECSGLITLINGTENPEKLICQASYLNCGYTSWDEKEVENKEQQCRVIKELLKGGRRRELEQANFTIRFNKISLAGITHLVRHRMQSIIIPNYIDICDFRYYVMPGSIENSGLQEHYRKIYEKSKNLAAELLKIGLDKYDYVYLLLSGLVIPVMTTMNANELNVFLKLRTCNRAQWEIKECADELLKVLREKHPVLFSAFGPSCYVEGMCPEGKMTCGTIMQVCEKYTPRRR